MFYFMKIGKRFVLSVVLNQDRLNDVFCLMVYMDFVSQGHTDMLPSLSLIHENPVLTSLPWYLVVVN